MRLKWECYRLAGMLGTVGLGACAILLAALVAHQAFVMPSIKQQERELTRIASQQIERTKEIQAYRDAAKASVALASVGTQHMLNLAGKYGLSTREAKYQQIQAGKNAQGDARILITLPGSSSYPQFRGAMMEMATLPGVRMEAFSLTRKTPGEEMLAIEMKLSVHRDLIKEQAKEVSQ